MLQDRDEGISSICYGYIICELGIRLIMALKSACILLESLDCFLYVFDWETIRTWVFIHSDRVFFFLFFAS
jgi:hypothetical protein